MFSLRTLTISIILMFMMVQSMLFASSDTLSFILILSATLIIFNATLKLQMGSRKALRANAKKGGFLFHFLSKDKSIFVILISFFTSLLFATMLVLILKGIIMNHGVIAFFIIIGGISFTIFHLLNSETTNSAEIDNNLQGDIAKHANDLMYVFIVAVVLNAVLSLILSAHDTMSLLNSNIMFSNFDEYAIDSAIVKTDSNHYTRIMINLYLLLDYFKLALTTEIMAVIIPDMQDRKNWFYLFFVIVFLLNMMKLFAFSLAFVLMQKGMETSIGKILPIINNRIGIYKERYISYKEQKQKHENDIKENE